MTIGIVWVASLAARVGGGRTGDNHVDLETHQFGRKRRETIELSLRRPPLNHNVFPLDVTKIAKTLPERLDAGRD